jgi:hypothetical protein
VEINRVLRASDEDFRAWSDQPLFDKYVSALTKPRRIKYSGVGSRDATDVNSALGGTSTATGGSDALAFGGLDAPVGDAGDGIDLKLLASGEFRSLSYCSDVLSIFKTNVMCVCPLLFASMVIVQVLTDYRLHKFQIIVAFFRPKP